MTGEPIKILMVDDDEDDFIIVRHLLAEIDPKGYQLEWINNFDDGLKALTDCEHDVFLIDLRLGGRDGLELLTEAHRAGCQSPLILLTGQNQSDIDTKAMRAGAEDFLSKGQLTAQDLERSIRYAIERKRAAKEIQKLAAFPRHNPIPVLEFSEDGTLTYSNDAAQSLARSLGKYSINDILPSDTAAIVHRCLHSSEPAFHLDTTFAGRTVSWAFVSIPINKVVHCYAKEITERLNLEAQLRQAVKMDAVGQLSAGIAHDFNNILTVIQGHAELLLHRSKLDSENERPLQQISLAADRAGNLIRQLLMFSRKQVLQPTQLNLNETVGKMIQMVQRVLGEHIALKFVQTPNLPAIYADASMIEQALLNLVINARDAMPNGGELTISTGLEVFNDAVRNRNSDARAGTFVCINVSDTGCGIAPEIILHIFEPFFTTKEVGKGTGLGLATVYGIAKQHNGWIEVENGPNRGATFKIYFPSSTKTAEAVAPEPPQLSIQSGNETILVVEDEVALRELVADILQLCGYTVYQAGSGPAAIRIWKEHKNKINLLLTDMVMPEGMSGRQLAEELHKDDPSLKVIYTSGYSPGMAGRDVAVLKGFNFLPKPYPPTKLAQLVRECLDKGR